MQDQYFQWGVALFLITITWFVSEIWKHSNQIKGGISRLASLNQRSAFTLYLKPLDLKPEQSVFPVTPGSGGGLSCNFAVYSHNYVLDQKQIIGYALDISEIQAIAKSHKINNPLNEFLSYYAVPTDEFTRYIQELCDENPQVGRYIYALANKAVLGKCARIDL
jgi:hypothetical protein